MNSTQMNSSIMYFRRYMNSHPSQSMEQEILQNLLLAQTFYLSKII